MPLEKDTLLNGRYRIQDTLGKGGMGAVYVALDESLGVSVALKENLLEDEDAIQQFRKEATILASLRHPNLPRVTDHFVIAGQGQYLVMDFIQGEDLKMRLQRTGALPEKEVLLIGIAISDALNYLHTLSPPVLHRDIKPGNIRITPRGEVFLVDFGLAKQVESGQATATGARGLTPGYSPPEQYGTARTDARSDIYALGATLYSALTGFPPEDGLSVAINQTRLTPVRTRNPKISQPVAEAIEKALEVNSEDRYQSGSEFKQKLLEISETVNRQVAIGDVTVTPPPADETQMAAGPTIAREDMAAPTAMHPDSEPTGQPAAPKSRNMLWAVLGGIGIIGILAVLAFTFLGNPQGKQEDTQTAIVGESPTVEPTSTTAPTATEEIKTPTDSPTNTALPTDTLVPTVTFTPAPTSTGGGGMIAFAADRDGEVQIYLLDMVTQETTQLTYESGGACQPSWSPDGMRLVFTAPCSGDQSEYSGTSLFIINVDGTGLTPVTFSPIGDYDPAWSPVSNQIAFTTIRDFKIPQIWLLDLDTGEPRNISNNYRSGVYEFNPDWSPDGEMLVFATNRDTGRPNLWAMDLNAENRVDVSYSNSKMNTDPDWSPLGDLILFSQSGGRGVISGINWRDGNPRDDDEFLVANVPSDAMKEPDISPDGFWVVYTGGPDRLNSDLYMMRINGSGMTQLTDTEYSEFDPTWRPVP